MAKSKSKRRRKVILFGLFTLVLVGLGAAAFLRKHDVVIPVQVEKVTRRNITETVVANGYIQPVVSVNISPEVSGEIIALPVKEGQHVKKGDLLVKINPNIYISARNSAEASYQSSLAGRDSAEASMRKAESDYKRNESLHAEHLLSDADFLGFKTAYEVAQAQYQSAIHNVAVAQAALKRADEDLAKTTITSPLDGTIVQLNSEVGERVVGTSMMAGTVIMTVADLNQMEARVDVGENDVVLTKVGQKASLEVDAFKERKFKGVVTEVANSAEGFNLAGNASTQSQSATKFQVRIRILEKEPFRPGMTVTAEIQTRYRTNVLAVPIASVTTRLPKRQPTSRRGTKQAPTATNEIAANDPVSTNNATTNVAVNTATNTAATNQTTRPKKPGEPPKPIEVVFIKVGDHVKMVPVKRGISDDSYTEITEGVKAGEEVVSGGYKAISRELQDGSLVRIGTPAIEKLREVEK